jgi:hypothetical protein
LIILCCLNARSGETVVNKMIQRVNINYHPAFAHYAEFEYSILSHHDRLSQPP